MTTLTPGLLVQEIDGSLRFEVQSGDIADVATVTLVAVVLDSLTIEVSTVVEQQEQGSTLTVAVTVRAVNSRGTAINPEALVLQAAVNFGAVLDQTSYLLRF